VLLVSDAGVWASGLAPRLGRSLLLAGLAVETDIETPNEPCEADVSRLAGRAIAWDVDGIVAVGGGSSIDAAKGAALEATNGGPVGLWWRTRAPASPLPIVAVPTTAGTGSDAQSHALISGDGAKMAIGHPGLMPVQTWLCPEVLATCPRDVLRVAGLDALVHTLEVAATTAGTASSRALGLVAFEGLLTALPPVLDGVGDASHHARLLEAATLAGAAIEASMLGACHALGNALTLRYGVPHGLAVAVASRTVVPATLRAGSTAWHPLARAGGVAPEAFGAWWEALLDGLGAPADAAPWGATPEDAADVDAQMRAQWTMGFHPVPIPADAVFAVCGAR
jgi:alcohol dehydrogenase